MPSASAWRARRKDSLKGRIMRIQEKDLRFTAAGLFFNFNQAFGNLPKSLLYFSQDRIKKPSYF